MKSHNRYDEKGLLLLLGQEVFDAAVGDEPDDGDEDVQAACQPGAHEGQRNGRYVNQHRYFALKVAVDGRRQ